MTVLKFPDLRRRVKTSNHWRDNYNPLRGLTMRSAIGMLEQADNGLFPDLQWCYEKIEGMDPDLLALIERRSSAMVELDFNIKTVSPEKAGSKWNESLADDQAQVLRDAYERIQNLYEALDSLALASFRGYSFLQIVGEPKTDWIEQGQITLDSIDQWHWCRDGYKGDWYFNPESRMTTAKSLSELNRLAVGGIDPNQIILREVRRPINKIALIKYIRSNLSQKDWDGYIEIYGIPGCFIILPPNIPDDKIQEQADRAEEMAEGGSGALLNGSDVKFANEARGSQPFQQHLAWLQQQLVLAGTGGLLTMLSMPQGIGSGSTDAHADAFKAIARAEARKISECLQKQFDRQILNHYFPGESILAYFDLAANESVDPGTILDHAVKAKQAGFDMAADEASEKTGYTFTRSAPSGLGGPPMAPSPFITNRESASPTPSVPASPIPPQVLTALAADLAPLRERIKAIIALSDPAKMDSALRQLRADLPKFLEGKNPDSAAAFEKSFLEAFSQGVAQGKPDATPGAAHA